MEIDKYLPPLEFALANPEESGLLATLAYNFLQTGAIPQTEQNYHTTINRSGFINISNTTTFTNSEALVFFYIYHHILEDSKKLNSEDDWIAYLSKITTQSFRSFREKAGYDVFEVAILIINRIYRVNIAKLIVQANGINKIIESSYWDTLPYIVAPDLDIIQALFVSTEGIKPEDNYLDLNKSVRVISKSNPKIGEMIIQKAKFSIEKLRLFCPYAFLGLSEARPISEVFHIVEELLKSQDDEQKKIGLRSLAMLHGDKNSPQEIENLFLPLLEEIEDRNEDSLNAELIFVYGLLIDKLSVSRRKLITIPSQSPGKDTLFALSRILSLKIENEIEEKWPTAAFAILSDLSGQHLGTYKLLDWTFHRIVKNRSDLILNYFELFIANDKNNLSNIEAFRHTFTGAYKFDQELVCMWITVWLNNDNPRFHVAVSKVLSLLWLDGERSIRLHESTINKLSALDIEFILFKVVGYVLAKEHLESLVFSALTYKESAGLIEDIVTQLFCHHIVYNYPSTMKYLKQQEANGNEVQVRIINIINQHYEETYSLKSKKPQELASSPARLQILFNQETKKLSDFQDPSPFKETSFLDLFTNITLKTGKHFFSRDDHSYGMKNRYGQKSTMGQISQSFEMPGGEFIDPVGQEYNRHMWRRFKRRVQ